MGVYTIACMSCNNSFQWFSGNTGKYSQVCLTCIEAIEKKELDKLKHSVEAGDWAEQFCTFFEVHRQEQIKIWFQTAIHAGFEVGKFYMEKRIVDYIKENKN